MALLVTFVHMQAKLGHGKGSTIRYLEGRKLVFVDCIFSTFARKLFLLSIDVRQFFLYVSFFSDFCGVLPPPPPLQYLMVHPLRRNHADTPLVLLFIALQTIHYTYFTGCSGFPNNVYNTEYYVDLMLIVTKFVLMNRFEDKASLVRRKHFIVGIEWKKWKTCKSIKELITDMDIFFSWMVTFCSLYFPSSKHKQLI